MKVELMSTMLSDEEIAEFACVSTGKKPKNTKRTIERLSKGSHGNIHWTPFGLAQISMKIDDVPIYIARHIFRHNVGFVRVEKSRRYTKNETKDCSPHFETLQSRLEDLQYESKMLYKSALDVGIKPENARACLLQSQVTSWIETGSLFAYASMMKQRCQKDVQKETRQLVLMMWGQVKKIFPISCESLEKNYINLL